MRHGRFKIEAPELNLVPIMNMVMCLIPVILFGASTVKLGVIEVKPIMGGCHAQDGTRPLEQPLNLSVEIEHEGIRLAASHPGFAEIVPEAQRFIPKGEAELMTLYNQLSALRTRYPDEGVFTITASPRVDFQRVVSVLDASRYKLELEQPSSPAAFARAQVKREEGRPLSLWDNPLFTTSLSD